MIKPDTILNFVNNKENLLEIEKHQNVVHNSIELCENEINEFIIDLIKKNKPIDVWIKFVYDYSEKDARYFKVIKRCWFQTGEKYCVCDDIKYDIYTFVDYLKNNGYETDMYLDTYHETTKENMNNNEKDCLSFRIYPKGHKYDYIKKKSYIEL